MRLLESLVVGLENVGVTAALGGVGETCTGMMIAGVIERIEERMRGADKP